MRGLLRTLTQLSINGSSKTGQLHNPRPLLFLQKFSTQDGGSGGDGNKEPDWMSHFGATDSSGLDPMNWGEGSSSWSTGLTKDHFVGEAVGKKVDPNSGSGSGPASGGSDRAQRSSGYSRSRRTDDEPVQTRGFDARNRRAKGIVDSWDMRMEETTNLLKQVREPGSRGSYLKDSEKTEMYKKHKQNPEEYTVERLAKDYRIMRQRVLAILFLKEHEEKMEKKHGPLDDSVELLLDTCPEFFNYHDREFHVASLPFKPEFRVMPEDWHGTVPDPDELLYEASVKEDEMLYREFAVRLNFNIMKWERKVKCHKYSRRRPPQGWNFMVEKLGPRFKRGNGGGWKFISEADGSSRSLNDYEKMFVKRETPHRRRRILP